MKVKIMIAALAMTSMQSAYATAASKSVCPTGQSYEFALKDVEDSFWGSANRKQVVLTDPKDTTEFQIWIYEPPVAYGYMHGSGVQTNIKDAADYARRALKAGYVLCNEKTSSSGKQTLIEILKP